VHIGGKNGERKEIKIKQHGTGICIFTDTINVHEDCVTTEVTENILIKL
jgi:hypothetical protein